MVEIGRSGPHERYSVGIRRQDLREVFEAYLVFCENGRHRTAWRNLGLALTNYLIGYYQFPNGIHSVAPNSISSEYIESLSTEHFGYLLSDLAYVLLRDYGPLPLDPDFIPLRFFSASRSQSAISTLYETELHRLLVEVAIPLGPQSSTTQIPHLHDLRFLPLGWSPLYEGPSSRVNYAEALFDTSKVSALPELKTTSLINTSRNILRRALSTGFRYSNRIKSYSPSTIIQVASIEEAFTPATQRRELPTKEVQSSFEWEPRDYRNNAEEPSLEAIEEEEEEYESQPDEIEEITEDFHDGGKDQESYTDQSSALSTKTSNTSMGIHDVHIPDLRFDQPDPSKSITGSRSLDSLRDTLLSDAVTYKEPARHTYTFSRDDAIEICLKRNSKNSDFSDCISFMTAKSQISLPIPNSVLSSRRQSFETFHSLRSSTASKLSDRSIGEYCKLLKERNLIPDQNLETNWSGRGQHVEYSSADSAAIPLEVEGILGQTRTALVESVRCKRVRLVRKTIRCTKWTGVKREDALHEVQHLYCLQHPHIVRLVGTYVLGNDLSILMYPCAEWNLEKFLQSTPIADDASERCSSLQQFFTCLANAVDFMHSVPIKHMDIKPQNLLVRDMRGSTINGSHPYKIYFTDFGISRSYESQEQSETETPASFTRAYAPMELVLQESRGLPVDIFSLGCVFAEMLATILDESNTSIQDPSHWSSLQEARGRSGLSFRPYYSAVDNVRTWLSSLTIDVPKLDIVRNWIIVMIDSDPTKRPTIKQIVDDPALQGACLSCMSNAGPEDFEVAKALPEEKHVAENTATDDAG